VGIRDQRENRIDDWRWSGGRGRDNGGRRQRGRRLRRHIRGLVLETRPAGGPDQRGSAKQCEHMTRTTTTIDHSGAPRPRRALARRTHRKSPPSGGGGTASTASQLRKPCSSRGRQRPPLGLGLASQKLMAL